MVWILRSKTRTLAKWVMSPANLKMFIFVELGENGDQAREMCSLFAKTLYDKSASLYLIW